jgi:hypothetical protein
MTDTRTYSASLPTQDWDLILEALQDYICKCLESKIEVLTDMKDPDEQKSYIEAFDALVKVARDVKVRLRTQLTDEIRKGHG